MTDYRTVNDPYCYPGTRVLINSVGLRDANLLAQFEGEMFRERMRVPLPFGRFDVAHYKALHKHLFGDVFAWAGEFRSVRIEKSGSVFCYPENIELAMTKLFHSLRDHNLYRNLSREEFICKAAHFLAEINAIHPFREGNGRTQTVFLTLISHQAGYPLDLEKLEPSEFLQAMVASFHGDESHLVAALKPIVAG